MKLTVAELTRRARLGEDMPDARKNRKLYNQMDYARRKLEYYALVGLYRKSKRRVAK